MTFKEAYESGKSFKRKDWTSWRTKFNFIQDQTMYLDNILADDWELKPEPKVLKCWVNFYMSAGGFPGSYTFDDKSSADLAARVIGNRIGEAVEVTKIVEEV